MVGFEYDVPLVAKLDQYAVNSQPAILCYEKEAVDDGTSVGLYGILTVNLDDGYVEVCNGNDDNWFYQYVDVNNWPGIEDVLAGCSWCKPTGIVKPSGYVEYPLYKFNKEAF